MTKRLEFAEHIVRVALALGLVLGLLLFSALLYVSDFGARRPGQPAPPPASMAGAAVDTPGSPAEQNATAHSVLTWVFGESEDSPSP